MDDASASRAGAGALAGVVATIVMDAVTNVLYTEHIKNEESRVAPRSASAAVAMQLMQALDLLPTEKDAESGGKVLHWAIGVKSGALGGLISGERQLTALNAGLLVAAGMFAFDELGLSWIGATPPSWRYPWQTNLRSLVGHASYAVAWAVAYAFLRSLRGRR